MRVLTTKVVNLLSMMDKLDSKLPAGSLFIPSANSYEVRVPIACTPGRHRKNTHSVCTHGDLTGIKGKKLVLAVQHGNE